MFKAEEIQHEESRWAQHSTLRGGAVSNWYLPRVVFFKSLASDCQPHSSGIPFAKNIWTVLIGLEF